MSVIIVGGGMAGATLALALSRLTEGALSIDLVEAKLPASGQHPGFDSRSIALAQGTCQKLEQIGVWSVLKDNAEAIESIHVSDKGHFGLVSLSASDYQLPAFGQVIELYDAGHKLFSLLKKHQNIRIHCPSRMVGVHRTEQHVEIRLDNGETLTGQLAIAADGSYSPLAKAVNIQWQSVDYRQFAVIANVQLSDPKSGQAFERFTSQGPLALLPMTSNRYSLVWCHDITRQEELAGWSDERFIYELQREFGWRLGAIKRVGQRHNYPLALRYTRQQISHRVALVSNASQTLHPIAGQGFNLGLRDVMTLAEVVSGALKKRQDLGCYSVLRQYQQARQNDRQFAIGLTDGLIDLFANKSPFLAGVRNLAMLAMDNSHFLQRRLVEQTLGQFKCQGK